MEKVNDGGIFRFKHQVWTCQIGSVLYTKIPLNAGMDAPMRAAVSTMYMHLFHEPPRFLLSGWNSELTDGDIESLENFSDERIIK